MVKRLSNNEFIIKSNLIHDNKFLYYKTDYKTKRHNVIITCKIHGDFSQLAGNHLNGHGCKQCQVDSKRINKDKFIELAMAKHNNKYNYSLVKITGMNDKVTIICPHHGSFRQNAGNHIYEGKGCIRCRIDKCTDSLEDFLQKSIAKHGDRYDYSLSIYTNTRTKIKIICKKHGVFKQLPKNHYIYGCEKCGAANRRSVSKIEIEWLDYLGIPNDQRSIILYEDNRRYFVDAYNKETKTIYEFYGDFWHGNPTLYDGNDVNKVNKRTFKDLYVSTINREFKLKKLGYNIVSIWENDFRKLIKYDKKKMDRRTVN